MQHSGITTMPLDYSTVLMAVTVQSHTFSHKIGISNNTATVSFVIKYYFMTNEIALTDNAKRLIYR